MQRGETLKCLFTNFASVKGNCRTRLLRVAELQAGNITFDRALYFACRDDAARFCSDVIDRIASGNVYTCLYQHKTDNIVSTEVGSVRS